jgi:hypothetical protein
MHRAIESWRSFLDEVTSPPVLDDVLGRADDEELRLGRREIYVRYGAGMASKLRIPAAKKGTARNRFSARQHARGERYAHSAWDRPTGRGDLGLLES